MESPTQPAPKINGIATDVLLTRPAGIINKPADQATVTIPLRVRVSFQPRLISVSASHPPIGSVIPKMKNVMAASRPAFAMGRPRPLTK